MVVVAVSVFVVLVAIVGVLVLVLVCALVGVAYFMIMNDPHRRNSFYTFFLWATKQVRWMKKIKKSAKKKGRNLSESIKKNGRGYKSVCSSVNIVVLVLMSGHVVGGTLLHRFLN